MNVKNLVEIIDADFYAGVPDSQLRALCDYLIDLYGTDPTHHIIAANEGNCAALAAGYHLATGKVPAVYMQNSGQGNIINPLASLLNKKVYGIPCVFVIGWRGEPGVHDEPQHIYQGEVTLTLLQDMGIESFVLENNTSEEALCNKMSEFRELLAEGKDVAIVVRKGALTYDKKNIYKNNCVMLREEIIRQIVRTAGNDPIVSTTGKASRELYEIREENGQGHQQDFLTVGSMGHSSSIAFGIALNKPDTKVWCIDGDGAALMHMGAMAVIGQTAPDNLIHIVINNGAHESVGGIPTAAGCIDLVKIAEGCGYKYIYRVSDYEELNTALEKVKNSAGLAFLEVKAAVGARSDLGRPACTPEENKKAFMVYLNECK
jgi:phosphonopyruvate decarboxylase